MNIYYINNFNILVKFLKHYIVIYIFKYNKVLNDQSANWLN